MASDLADANMDKGAAGDNRQDPPLNYGCTSAAEYSGSLSWDDFQLAIDQLKPFSEKLGDGWIKENEESHLPGGTFLSYTRYAEIESSLLKCDYHIVYSLSYSVPVMYFNMSFPTGKLLSVDEVCKYFKKSIFEVSQQEHPVLHVPFFCLHPCHTSEIMKTLSNSAHSSRLSYLVAWLSLVASILDLPLSNEYGQLIKGINSMSDTIPNGEKCKGADHSEHFKSSSSSSIELLSEKLKSKDAIEELILEAVKNETLTEAMLAVSDTRFPKSLEVQVVETYAQQLIAKDEKLLAIGFFPLIGQRERVIRTLLQKGSYHQAIVLGKWFLQPSSELMEEIYDKAVAHFLKIRSYSVAIRILCSIGKYAEALASLDSLNSKTTLETAIYLADKIGDADKAVDLRNRLEAMVAVRGGQ